MDWTNTKDFLDIAKNVAEIIAIAIGGAWAYFNFFKGRTYRSRLEPKIFGRLISKDGMDYLVITSQLKNVGLSDVEIAQKGSAVRVFIYPANTTFPKLQSVEQTRLATLFVFESHGWIESGETIEEQRLVTVPDVDYIAIQVQLRLVSNKIEWNSAAIIEHLPKVEGQKIQPLPEGKTQLLASGKSKVEQEKEVNLEKSVGSLPDSSVRIKEDAAKSRAVETEKRPA